MSGAQSTTVSSGYTLTIHISNPFTGNGAIPHAFVTISGPGVAPVTVGFYPKVTGVSGAGTVRNDALSHIGLDPDLREPHPSDQSLQFQVSAQQALNALNFAANTANNPGQYQLLGAVDGKNLFMKDGYQCTGFARDVAKAAGIIPIQVESAPGELLYPSTLGGMGVEAEPANIYSSPGSLYREFSGLGSNQVQPFRTSPSEEDFAAARTKLYGGIDAQDPTDRHGTNERIQPIGSVAIEPNGNTPLTPAQVQQKVADGFSPVGWEPIGKSIADNFGNTHSWRTLPDGSVERVSQAGGAVTTTSYPKGSATPSFERQTVAGSDGIVSDTLLKPDASGKMVVAKVQLGGLLDDSAFSPPTVFNPATALPNAPHSEGNTPGYVVQPGDTVSGIAIKLGLTPQQYSDYLKSVYGPNADLNSIVAGRELPVPADAPHAGSKPEASDKPLAASPSADNDYQPDSSNGEAEAQANIAKQNSNAATTDQLVDVFTNAPPAPKEPGIQLAAAGGFTLDSTSNQPAAPVERAQPAPETIAKETAANKPPIVTQGQLDTYNAATTFNQSVKTLSNWDNTNDAEHFSAVGGVLNSYNKLEGNSLGNLSGYNTLSSVVSLTNWDHTSDTAHINSLSALANNYNTWTEGGTALIADNIKGFNQLAGYANLAQSLQDGNVLGTLSSINSLNVNNPIIDNAINQMVGTTGIPYLGVVMALNDFENHPGQSIGTLIGMSFGPAGAMVGGLIGGLLDGMGEHAPPPPPEGIIHYQFDANGQISVAVDQDQSGGGAPAKEMGENLLQLMQGMVQAINAQSPDTADHLTLNPDNIPRVGYSNTGGMWLEVTLPGGLVTRESIDSDTIATRLLQLLDGAGGLAPVWLMDTVKQGGASVEAVQNHATQSADGKSQSYGAMVIHIQGNANLNEAIQNIASTQQTAGESVVYRNADGDAYLEKTQWVGPLDSEGNAQGMLVLDLNANGVIETGDILGDMNWLDANKDGVINASDPGFAAIKLWVDVNQDGVLQKDEGQNLGSLQIAAFNLATGQVLYSDGSSSTITVETLQADTAGVKKTEVRVVDEDGKLQTVDAGTLIEHESTEGGVVTYEHYAKRTGDWEGTADQEAHRHGGGNAEGAPTETFATGAISVGPVRAGQTVILSNHIEAGDGRFVSDTPTTEPVRAPNATTVINAGDSRIQSDPSSVGMQSLMQQAQVQGPLLALIPRAPENVQNAMRIVTQEMIESAQGGRTIGLDMAALAAIGLGAIQTTVFAAPSDFVQENAPTPPAVAPEAMQWAFANVVSGSGESIARSSSTLTSANSNPTSGQLNGVDTPRVFRHVDLGNFTSDSPKPSGEVLANPFDGPSIVATLIVESSNSSNSSDGASGEETAARNQALSGPGQSGGISDNVIPLDYPKVRGETLAGMEDLVLRMDSSLLLANDSTLNAAADRSQPALKIVSVGQPEHGQISLQSHTDAQGNVVTEVLYAPERDFHGAVSFTYTVADQYGLSRSATATLQIAGVNDAPQTANENVRSNEDAGLILDPAQLLANDRDADTATDGQVLTISRVGDAQHGTTWIDAQGSIRFLPEDNYHGPAQLTYWVSDGAGGETPATVNLLIAAVNDLPITMDESSSGTEDIGMIFAQSLLLANDSDPDAAVDGQVLTVSRVGGAVHGTTWMDAQGDVRFAPEANYHGPAQFNYWVSDGNGGETIATVSFVLTGVNDAPVTANENATGTEDVGLLLSIQQLLANDSDPDIATDGQTLSLSRIGTAQHGTAWLDGTGNVRFVPDPDYNGPASFTYWVTDNPGLESMASVNLTIASVNDLPVVTGETVSSDEDTTLLFNPATLLANDTDIDGNTLTISTVGNATHGTVSLVGGQVQFVPDANYNGTAGFSYTVNDGDGGLVTGTVVLNLAPINDAPVVQDDSAGTGFEGTPRHISFASLLANDSDPDAGDTLTIDAVGSATHGTVAIVNGEVVFTPDAAYHGPASFVYRVVDSSGAQATGLATLNFSGVNDMPVGVGETISTIEDTTLLISSAALLQNDTDPDIATDGQVLSLVAVSNAQHGTVTLLGNGTIQFIPDPDFYGNASFAYTISDGAGGTAQATATISIANVNDAPVATGETAHGQVDQVLNISAAALLQNEYDSDNSLAQLSIYSVQSGSGGTAALNSGGDVVFTPQPGFIGNATFSYSVRDPSGEISNTVTTTIVVAAAPNTSPTVQGEIVAGASEDAVFHISKGTLLANDYDFEDPNSALSIVLVGGATNGSVSLDGNGDVVFTPNQNFNGAASFQYQVRDSEGALSATVQAIIPVAAVNDLPVGVDDQFQTYKNSSMTIAFNQLTGNDSDIDGDALTVSGVRNASNGAVSVVGGNVQFVPTAGFTGTASFEYQSDDGHGGQTWASAQVTVSNPPNLYPSMSISYFNFYPTGSTPGNLYDIAFANMTPSDDGNVGAMTIQYLSGSYQVRADSGHAGWQPLSGLNVNIFEYTITSFHMDVQRGDALAGMQTTWRITDDQGLVNIWHFDYSVGGGYSSYMDYTGYAPPLVLALNNMPSEYISTHDSNVYFDMNGDGILDKLAWAAPGSGVLGIDLNGDGRISNANEFAFKQYVHGAQTDLEGLVAFDSNHNGTLDSGDAQWAKFGVWEDKNADGQTQEGEYQTLDDLGIASIDLHSNAQMHTPSVANGATDVVVMGEGSFSRTDGSSGVTSDAMFTYQTGKDASAADISRMANVFNQFSNVELNYNKPPLGFVSLNEDVHYVEDYAMRVTA